MAIEGLHTRRVIKSLQALESYLDRAAHIAGGVSASETLKLELEAPGPSLNSVIWQKTGTSSITQSEAVANPRIRVFGDNLTHRDDNDKVVSDVTSITLVGPKAVTLEAAAAAVTAKSDGELEATLTFKTTPPPSGAYDAHVTRSDDESAGLSNACSITDKPAAKGD